VSITHKPKEHNYRLFSRALFGNVSNFCFMELFGHAPNSSARDPPYRVRYSAVLSLSVCVY